MALLKIVDLIFGLSVSAEEKKAGSDYSQHGENLPEYNLLKEEIA
jgi:ammonia channel protein AmtB